MKIRCDCCDGELTEQGALLFGPPLNHLVAKWHICGECYKDIVNVVLARPTPSQPKESK